ncbi:MAG: GDP-mannose 4,6-dehydratase [Acidimicrobiia bacterium]
MKALVTGASGFAGRHLVAHLTEAGDSVIACDRAGVDAVDIVDRDAVHQAFARFQPEVVYHLAALTHVGDSWNEPQAVLRVNVEGTLNVLDAAQAAGVRRVLVVGSAEEYGRAGTEYPLREDAPLLPNSPYAATKVAASYLALQAYLGAGLETVRVRAFNHTGPGQTDRFLIPALARRIAEAERDGHDHITVGSLDPVRDINDVRDIVRAYRLAVLEGEPGAVYNVCSGAGHSVGEIAAALLARARVRLRLVQDPNLVRPVDVPSLIGDASRLRAATKWQPAFTLEATLVAVLDEARANAAR